MPPPTHTHTHIHTYTHAPFVVTPPTDASETLTRLRQELERAEANAARRIELATAEQSDAMNELMGAEAELEAAVNCPLSGGRDPTEWLPDELLTVIMLMLPFKVSENDRS
jgi:hypothetical protein